VPLARGEMEIELAASPAELAQLIDRIREAWTHLGKVRPHHSVLTGDAYLPEALDEAAIERFYDSGKQELSSMIEAILERHGFAGLESKTCVEYGCGLGRVTLALASKCAAVHGYDISPNHLALAEKRAAETGAGNVRFHLCTADVIGKPLEPCDFFFSCIVFQHNPPPIMLAMLSASLQSLRVGGIAIFQLPTYGTGYSFRIQDYLAAPRNLEIEMHCLPQEAVFSLIAHENCKILEVREDDWVGDPGRWISNTFVVTRPAVPPWRRVFDDASQRIGGLTSKFRYQK
jgi:SAM-dependent methyltransferase